MFKIYLNNLNICMMYYIINKSSMAVCLKIYIKNGGNNLFFILGMLEKIKIVGKWNILLRLIKS